MEIALHPARTSIADCAASIPTQVACADRAAVAEAVHRRVHERGGAGVVPGGEVVAFRWCKAFLRGTIGSREGRPDAPCRDVHCSARRTLLPRGGTPAPPWPILIPGGAILILRGQTVLLGGPALLLGGGIPAPPGSSTDPRWTNPAPARTNTAPRRTGTAPRRRNIGPRRNSTVPPATAGSSASPQAHNGAPALSSEDPPAPAPRGSDVAPVSACRRGRNARVGTVAGLRIDGRGRIVPPVDVAPDRGHEGFLEETTS